MNKHVIATDKAPKAVGPYSQGIRVGDLIFTAGQIGLDPATGKMVTGGVEEQAQQVLTNLTGVLESAGSSMDLVIKTTVFLADIAFYPAVNEIYAGFFVNDPPARSAVQVAALPLGALVEIEAVAICKA